MSSKSQKFQMFTDMKILFFDRLSYARDLNRVNEVLLDVGQDSNMFNDGYKIIFISVSKLTQVKCVNLITQVRYYKISKSSMCIKNAMNILLGQ